VDNDLAMPDFSLLKSKIIPLPEKPPVSADGLFCENPIRIKPRPSYFEHDSCVRISLIVGKQDKTLLVRETLGLEKVYLKKYAYLIFKLLNC